MPDYKECDDLKAELEALRPIEKKNIDQIRKFWQVGLAYSSNAIEGNTLTETETKVILEDGITVGGKSMREHLEVLGHGEALNHLFKIYKKGISEDAIKNLHRLFYYRIDSEWAGKYREQGVIITGTDFTPPHYEHLPVLMKDFLTSIETKKHPIEQAAKIHEGLVNIHPFVDGNGRTARLAMNLVLLKNGYPVLVIPPILRVEYIEAAKAGNKGESQPFLSFLNKVSAQGLKDYLRLLKKL